MNARERKRLTEAVETYLPLEFREPILRALRLLAAAEANDWTTPETDENCIQGMFIDADFSRLFERERNGLAARVVELEKDAERYRFLRECAVGSSPPDKNTVDWRIRIDDTEHGDFDAAIDAARGGKP